MDEPKNWETLWNFGLPTILLLVGSLAIWRMAVWARDEIVRPLLASHLALIDSLREEAPKQRVALSELKNSVDQLPAKILEEYRKEKSQA